MFLMTDGSYPKGMNSKLCSFFFFLVIVSNFLFVNEHQELQLDGFVTHEIQFEDINKAFDLLIEGQSLRCVIWMDK